MRRPWAPAVGPNDWRCEFCGCWSSNDYCFECDGVEQEKLRAEEQPEN